MDPPRKVKFLIQEDMAGHLDVVESGKVDLGIAATSITSEREQEMDFSNPFYRGGLGIVTQSRGHEWSMWDVVGSAELRSLMFWLALFILGCAHFIWYAEKGQNDTFDDRWLVGVGQAVWWTIVTMTTVGYGDFVPRKPLSRVLGVLMIVIGIVLFGAAVGAFSSALTVKRLQSDIRIPSDLKDRKVAVVTGTIAEEMLRERGISLEPKSSLEEALQAVEKHEVAAAVHDVALLRYYVRQTPGVALVGPTFAEHDYAITFPLGSELRKEVNIALLKVIEGDAKRHRAMLNEWFETP